MSTRKSPDFEDVLKTGIFSLGLLYIERVQIPA
jgi:hypothetical protein